MHRLCKYIHHCDVLLGTAHTHTAVCTHKDVFSHAAVCTHKAVFTHTAVYVHIKLYVHMATQICN